MRRTRPIGSLVILSLLILLMEGSMVSAQGKIDWAAWEKYRGTVSHPATILKPADLERARRNIARYPWAGAYAGKVRAGADALLGKLTPAYLARMIERTTPGCYTPCPACRAKGLPWHPNGQWSWSEEDPDRLTCKVCGTVFPNAQFPENVILQSKWDPEQKFTFVGGEPFNCFGYPSLPSPSGVIRSQKISRVTSHLNTLAIAYALTGEAKYARGAKAILLRFAEVLPKYLVRAGYTYGEIADIDPHVAAERIESLPEDELVTPPNRPNRKLHTGFWSASRIGSAGMDGGWVCRVTGAYDLTCTATENGVPVYSEGERKRIERDVLLEGAYLGLCDAKINNKSVGNRAGVAMVGLCVGHPDLVHFGLDGFRRTVEEWFLPDGGTSESASYALMTMSGIRDFALMFRDYSDPAGYAGAADGRIEHFDACRDTRYGDCWQGLIWTLQGDLHYPPSADSYRATGLDASWAELIALAYPTGEHLALLKERAGSDLAGGSPATALFYREPGLEKQATPRLSLPDVVFPFLAQGYLRTGAAGRDSLALLNASDWGNHHHQDSLDLYYWKEGHELLSDLGYLWDHPDKHQTVRSQAHNLVLIDGREQRTTGRGGSFHLFAATPRVKVMEASSRAYEAASVYRRTVLQVDHGPGGSYLVDVFRAQGGGERQYTFHGPGNDYGVEGLDLAANANGPGRQAAGDTPWRITWRLGSDYTFSAFSPGGEGEKVSLSDGWGQRDHRNSDRGAKLPYLTRAHSGPGLDVFVSVFAGAPAAHPLVTGARRLPLPAGAPDGAVLLAVETRLGTDVLYSTIAAGSVRAATPLGELATDGSAAAVLGEGGKARAAALFGGTRLALGPVALAAARAACAGKVLDTGGARGESYFVVAGACPQEIAGETLFVTSGATRRAYPVRAVRTVQGQTRVYTKLNDVGFEARPGESWEWVPTSAWEAP